MKLPICRSAGAKGRIIFLLKPVIEIENCIVPALVELFMKASICYRNLHHLQPTVYLQLRRSDLSVAYNGCWRFSSVGAAPDRLGDQGIKYVDLLIMQCFLKKC